MKLFRQGVIKLLIATEAAGMVRFRTGVHSQLIHDILQGADIPDIELVIQFGVPTSLSIFSQQARRAGHSANIRACAILLVEKSMFKQKKKKKPGGKRIKKSNESSSELDGGTSG
jgi:bloom syndrome protein